MLQSYHYLKLSKNDFFMPNALQYCKNYVAVLVVFQKDTVVMQNDTVVMQKDSVVLPNDSEVLENDSAVLQKLRCSTCSISKRHCCNAK